MNSKISFKKAIVSGLFAGLSAALVNVILFYIGRSAGIITDDIVLMPNQPMTVVPVIMSSIIPSLIAGIVFYMIDRFTKKGMLIFTVLSVVLLLLSFMNPFVAIPGITLSYGILLNVMHVTVVVALLFFLNRAKKSNS